MRPTNTQQYLARSSISLLHSRRLRSTLHMESGKAKTVYREAKTVHPYVLHGIARTNSMHDHPDIIRCGRSRHYQAQSSKMYVKLKIASIYCACPFLGSFLGITKKMCNRMNVVHRCIRTPNIVLRALSYRRCVMRVLLQCAMLVFIGNTWYLYLLSEDRWIHGTVSIELLPAHLVRCEH